MRRAYSLDDEQNAAVAINMAPLIDVVFLLLIFFVVTTTFEESAGIEIDKPAAVSAENLRERSILLALAADGQIYFGGNPVALQQVRGLVARQLQRLDRPVIVLADRRTQSGALIAVMDECRLAGAKKVNVATEKHE